MDEVICYAKNENLGFVIPYSIDGGEKTTTPTSWCGCSKGKTPLNLIIEVTGEKKKEKAAKVATARTLWVPAVNNHGGYGLWAFLEIADPWDAQNLIRAFLVNITTKA